MSNDRQKSKSTGGAWIRGQKREVGVQAREPSESGSLSSKRSVQFRDSELGSDDRAKRRRGRGIRDGVSSSLRSRQSEQGDNQTSSSSCSEVERRTILTLQEIYDALTREQIEDLYNNQFDPKASVEITKSARVSRFAEDCLIRIPKKRGGKAIKRKAKPPSVQFSKNYANREELGIDAKAVLGCYFVLYKRYYGEEDPEWVGKSYNSAISAIDDMAKSLCNGDYYEVLRFVEVLMPMWAKRLRDGENFPTSRPSFDTLFVRRKIWAQRFSLYKRWKS